MILFGLVLVVVAVATTWLHFILNEIVPEPYMDEIFHIPQVQAYCTGNLKHWDPKITTLPGLYFLSASFLTPAERLFGPRFGCTTKNLRYFNVMLNWLNLVLLYKINRIRLKDQSEVNKLLSTLSLGLTPLLFFFSFLYYTDPASTFAVLMMHYTFLRKQYLFSPLLGIVAVMMRQTNIVWLIWHGCNILWETGEKTFLKLLQPPPATVSTKKGKNTPRKPGKKPPKEIPEPYVPSVPLLNFRELRTAWPKLVKKVLPKCYMYAIVFGIFVAFIVLNEGIVMGDKEAHKASVNFPQLFYFAVFAMIFGFATVTYTAGETLESIRNNKLTYVFWILLGVAIVYFNTSAHPYLLADNRHYTFYIWKRLYETRPILKYLLVPVYIGFGVFMCTNINLHPSLIFTFIMVIAVNLVPQNLLEFRYFLLPYIMLRLHMKPSPTFVLFVELVWAILVNWITLEKFLYHPFRWPHSPEVQRFIW